jgi:very-short-patch-repair endonuclease
MKLSIQTIQKLSSIVTDYPYRSGPQLVSFFNQFNRNDSYGYGFPSRWKYTESILLELNDSPYMLRVIEQAVDARNFLTTGGTGEQIIAELNVFLEFDGFEVIKKDRQYRVRSLPEAARDHTNVKNIIFASNGPKPEIVIQDALNNDIRIVKNGEFCLIFDAPISTEGLLWKDIVNWWAQKTSLPYPDRDTERNFYVRLLSSLQSTIEKNLFAIYFKEFRDKLEDKLPALIPQVYLHYDPKTLKQLEGNQRIQRQRMDFLMLLPDGARVVIEADGKQHYSEQDIPSPSKYAEMVAEDRRLRLAGYDLYRFGGHELGANSASDIVLKFFTELFIKHGVIET